MGSQTNHSLRHRTSASTAWNQGKFEVVCIDKLFNAFTPSWRRPTVQVIKKETQISGKNYASWYARRRSYHRLCQCQPQILRYILICSSVFVVAYKCHFF